LEPKYTVFGEENIPNAVILMTFLLEGIIISALSESHRRSDVQKSEFIGIISHELKNPLTSIKGYAEMIQKLGQKNNEKKITDFALRIDRQTKQVIEMINEMLDITKIETGRLTYHDEIFSIKELTKEIVDDRQITTESHVIRLARADDRLLTGDRYRIGQVITNLISNAIKYSPNAKRVIVRVESKRSGVIISVQDFGSGIARQDRSKLFDPFFRAKDTQGAKGTGIGLFISSQIVERHKGKLWAESKKGRGSTFFLQLPAGSGK
jgi:signal transduction histidine kinase